jgi:hypothetical protein
MSFPQQNLSGLQNEQGTDGTRRMEKSRLRQSKRGPCVIVGYEDLTGMPSLLSSLAIHSCPLYILIILTSISRGSNTLSSRIFELPAVIAPLFLLDDAGFLGFGSTFVLLTSYRSFPAWNSAPIDSKLYLSTLLHRTFSCSRPLFLSCYPVVFSETIWLLVRSPAAKHL